MTARTEPPLEPGRVYRTRDLAQWGRNATRLAQRLVREGKLVPVRHGLFASTRSSRFGPVPPRDEELLRAFLDGGPFVLSGPDRWNALGLGTTALFAVPLVYNTKRSGEFTLGGKRFLLRRVRFPERPSPEWFVVDLFEHAAEAGTSPAALEGMLARAVGQHRFDRDRLLQLAREFGSRATVSAVECALG